MYLARIVTGSLTTLPILVFLFPVVVFAQNIGIPCDGPDCEFEDLMMLFRNIINFLAVIVIPLSAIAFGWAGFLYVTSGGSTDKVKRAHGIFTKVGIGLILTLGAYLIVNLVVLGLTGGDIEDLF